MSDKAVLTIATGKPIYIQMAVNLARSFKWWHASSDIRFALATDQKDLLPPDLSDIEVIDLQPGELGQGFSPKLHLDELAPADRTLFIDSDCLCYGSLETVFDKFEDHEVSVIGDTIAEGEFFGDVASICKQFQIEALPRFVGGLYSLKKGNITSNVFSYARSLADQYDQIGLVRLRDHKNEEPLIAISMAIFGQFPLHDDGTIKAERMCYDYQMKSDLLNSQAILKNSALEFPTWVHLKVSRPTIVHFNAHFTKCEPYLREVSRLENVAAKGWPRWLADSFAFVFYSFPEFLVLSLRTIFRPLYIKVIGFRKVASTDR